MYLIIYDQLKLEHGAQHGVLYLKQLTNKSK